MAGIDHSFGVVLVGMRGSGKSTVGRLLAEALGLAFADADVELEARTGEAIAQIFAQRGEPWFRERERELVLELLQRPGLVLATGGGAVLHDVVREVMRQRATVWLSADPVVLAARIAGSDRPSLTGAPPTEELAAVLESRRALYEDAAALVIDVGERTPQSVVQEVVAWRAGAGPDDA